MSKKAQKTHDSYKKNWNAHRARSLIIWAFFGHFPLLSPLLSKFWAFVQTPPPSSEQIPSILKTHTHIPVFILAVYWLLARAYSKNKPFFWRNVRPKLLKSYVWAIHKTPSPYNHAQRINEHPLIAPKLNTQADVL